MKFIEIILLLYSVIYINQVLIEVILVNNNSHFNNISQQKMHLMYVNTLCVKDWNQVLRTSSV